MKYLLTYGNFIFLALLFSFIDNFGMDKKSVENNSDYSFKVVFLGDADVGKTQIVSRYVKDSFVEEYKYTEGIGLGSKSISFNNKNINLQLYDTSGQERYRSIRQNYYKGSQLIVLVYAINNRNSFEHIPKWVEEVKIQNKDVKFLLVGNKCDLEEKRQVSIKDGEDWANANNMKFIEVSAKTGKSISDDMFNPIIKECLVDLEKEKPEFLLLNNQYIDSIKNKKTSCCSKYCSCCPCW